MKSSSSSQPRLVSTNPSTSTSAPPTLSNGRSASKPQQLRRELRRSIQESVRKQSLPWIRDLARPFVQAFFRGPPTPLPGLVDPKEVAEFNSIWVDVPYGGDGVTVQVHCTENTPPADVPFLGTLLLHHGFNGSTFSYRHVASQLAHTGYRVLAMDRPPFGLTERPKKWDSSLPSPYSNLGAAKLALSLLDELKIQEVVVIGHSAGSSICLEMHRLSPHRIRGVGLISPALPAEEGKTMLARSDLGQILRFALIRIITNDDTLGTYYVRHVIQKRSKELRAGESEIGLHDPSSIDTVELTEGYLKPTLTKDWDIGTVLQFRSFTENGVGFDYDKLSVPVGIVQGRYDNVTETSQVRRLAARLASREKRSDGGLRATTDAFHDSLLSTLERRRMEWLPTLVEWIPEGSVAGRTVYYEIEGTAHLPLDEKPEATAVALEMWLEGAGLGPKREASSSDGEKGGSSTPLTPTVHVEEELGMQEEEGRLN